MSDWSKNRAWDEETQRMMESLPMISLDSIVQTGIGFSAGRRLDDGSPDYATAKVALMALGLGVPGSVKMTHDAGMNFQKADGLEPRPIMVEIDFDLDAIEMFAAALVEMLADLKARGIEEIAEEVESKAAHRAMGVDGLDDLDGQIERFLDEESGS